jgi:hypothetical protein
MKKERKKRISVSANEYLSKCNIKMNSEEYLILEEKRKDKQWVEIIKKQNFCCFYCKTDIRIIQKLISSRIIGQRKRGPDSYSGFHFELDHKNADNKDNTIENLVAACYYCNNDKSNTISSEVFQAYFGPSRGLAFNKLMVDHDVKVDELFSHHLKHM